MTLPLWEQLARHWSRLGPPLRPCADDLRIAQSFVDASSFHANASTNVLILGVTPELRRLRWPANARVVACDRSMPMIRGIGQTTLVGDGNRDDVHHWLVGGDWRHLPLPDGDRDLAFCDAGLTQLGECRATEALREVRRVLRPSGSLVMRVFLRPDVDESPDDVWQHLLDRRFGSFHAFKLRLLASLHRADGVRVAEAWAVFASRCDDARSLADRLGWPEEQVRTIEAYRDQPTIYWLPTLGEFRAVVAAAGLDEVSCCQPSYELGERCPTFVLRRSR